MEPVVKSLEPAVDVSQKEKYRKLKRAIVVGVVLIILIVGYHLYENISMSSSNVEAAANDIFELTEQLYLEELQHEPYVFNLSLQCKTTNTAREDCAERPLLLTPKDQWELQPNSTISILRRLFQYYEPNVAVKEVHTLEKNQTELQFLKAILQTNIMKRTMAFLKAKNFQVHDQDEQLELLRDVWFTPYARGGKTLGSTGFEHVFLAELRRNKVLGLHNWIYYAEQEQLQHINYHGYLDHIDFGQKNHHYVAMRMTYHGKMKALNSFLIGTSPEFEFSLYTICFVLKAQKPCQIQLQKKRFLITTYIMKPAAKKTLATAYMSLIK